MSAVFAGALLALDVLLLAYVLTVVVRVLVRGTRRVRRRERQLVVRRCDGCRLAWQGEPGVDYGRLELLLRRRARRRARAKPTAAPAWAKARGWNRCPSCLSTRVRTSGDGEQTQEVDSRVSVEAAGYLATGLGLGLLVLAAAGFAVRG